MSTRHGATACHQPSRGHRVRTVAGGLEQSCIRSRDTLTHPLLPRELARAYTKLFTFPAIEAPTHKTEDHSYSYKSLSNKTKQLSSDTLAKLGLRFPTRVPTSRGDRLVTA